MGCPNSIYYTRSRELKCKLTDGLCEFTKIPMGEKCAIMHRHMCSDDSPSLDSAEKDSTVDAEVKN